MLNQRRVRELEHLFNQQDFTGPVVGTHTQDAAIQRGVVHTINKKVPADLKGIQDQGSQEILPAREPRVVEPAPAPATPSPSKSHLQLHISKGE